MCKKSGVCIVHSTTNKGFCPFKQCLFYVSLLHSMKTHTFRSKPELIAILTIALFCFMAANCHENPATTVANAIGTPTPELSKPGTNKSAKGEPMPSVEGIKVADPKTILARPEVPILCYH